MSTRKLFRLALVLAVATLALACRVRQESGLRTLTSADRDARFALGPIATVADRGGDPVEATRAIAELELRHGNLGAAARAARAHLDHSRIELAVLELGGTEGRELRRARRQLRRAAKLAVAIGDRARDGRLVLEAATLSGRPKRHRPEARNAAARIDYWHPRWDTDGLWRVVGPGARASLARVGQSDDPSVPELEDRDLSELKGAGIDLRERELAEVAAKGKVGPLTTEADELLTVDPLHVTAQVVGLVTRDLASGRLEGDERLLVDMSSGGNVETLARFEIRSRRQPAVESLALARAAGLLELDLVGDVRQAIAELPARKLSPEGRKLAQQLDAMAALPGGNVGAFERWASSRHADRSPTVRAFVAKHDRGGVVLELRKLAGRARRDSFVRPTPPTGWAAALATVLDERAGRRVRRRARDRLEALDPGSAAFVDVCRERRLGVVACEGLVGGSTSLVPDTDDDYDVDALAQLGRPANMRATWLAGASMLGSDELLKLGPILRRFEGTRIELDPAYHQIALRVAVARSSAAELSRAIERYGPVLSLEQSVWAQLTLMDLRAGKAPDDLLELHVWFPAPTWGGAESKSTIADIESWYPGDTRVARLLRGFGFATAGHRKRALAELEPLGDELDGAAGAEIAMHVALIALVDGREDSHRRSLTRIGKLAPSSFAAKFTRARVAQKQGDLKRARSLYGDASRRRPGSAAAFEGLVAAFPRQGPGRREIAFIDRGRPAGPHRYDFIATAGRSGHIRDLAHVHRMREAAEGSGETAWKLGAGASRYPPVRWVAMGWLLNRARNADDAEQAAARARDVLAYLEHVPNAHHWRVQQVWMHVLLGQGDQAIRVAKAFDPVHNVAPLPPSNWTALVARAQERGDVDEALAFELWRTWQAGKLTPAVQAIIDDPEAHRSLSDLACHELVAREELEKALPRCQTAWADPSASWGVGSGLAYILLNHGDAAAKLGVAAAEVFATQRSDEPDEAYWFYNRAYWLGRHGRHEEAADAKLRALAMGLRPGDQSADEDDLDQLRFRGATVRAQSLGRWAKGLPGELGYLGFLALRGGDLIAARAYAEAAVAGGVDKRDSEGAQLSRFTDAAVELVRADFRARELDKEGLAEVLALLTGSEPLEAFVALEQRYPESTFVDLLVLEELREEGEVDEALALARSLTRRFPTNPLVMSDALPLLVESGDSKRAAQLLARAKKRHPGHPWLDDIQLPESVTGINENVPAWARQPKSFDRRLAAITGAKIAKLAPKRRFDTAQSAEAFFPKRHARHPEQRLGTKQGGAWTAIVHEARASRCRGLDCATDLLAAWRKRGKTVLWTREVEIPAGKGVEILVSGPDDIIDVVVVPTGGSVFHILAGAPHRDFEAHLPTMKLVRHSFRPLDWVLSSFHAEALRASGPMPPDAIRLAARRELARASGRKCPAARTLARLDSDELRSALLLDLALLTVDGGKRRALYECVKPSEPAARRIGLLALLDDDARSHAFGRAAAAAHPDRTVGEARQFLFGQTDPAVSAPDYNTRLDLPRHGLLELAGALPPRHAHKLVGDLVRSKNESHRNLGLAAGAALWGVADREDLRARVRTGKPHEALVAARSLSAESVNEDLVAIRARARSREKARDGASRNLLLTLAVVIARELDPNDQRTLARLPATVATKAGDEDAKRTKEALEVIAKDHKRGVAIARRSTKSKIKKGDARAMMWVDRRRPTGTKPRSRKQLEAAPLARLLPGDRWQFARVANPGLFAATVNGLAHRLTSGAASENFIVREIVRRAIEDGGFALLSETGGLDVTRPIECATPGPDRGFVCSARVRDRNEALTRLAARKLGADAGVVTVLHFATATGLLPVALSAAPALLHGIVYPSDDPRPPSKLLAEERVRTIRKIAGYELDYYALVRVLEGRLVVDSEHYLFVGDRMFVFSSHDMARRILFRTPGPSLADQKAFARLTKDWKQGGALQAVALSGSSALGEQDISMEVVVDATGAAFHYAAEYPTVERGSARAFAVLPEGAVSSLAIAFEKPIEELDELEVPEDAEDAKRLPPFGVFAAARVVTFGWYSRPGDALWQRWVGVLALDAKVRRAARKAGLRPKRGKMARHGGLHFAEAGGFLIVGSDPELVSSAIGRATKATTKAGPMRIAAGRLDGGRAASVTRNLVKPGTPAAQIAKVAAVMLGLIDSASFDATWDPKTRIGNLSGHLRLNLSDAPIDTGVIDQWLASPEVRNASKLPRRLGRREPTRELSYVVAVDDAERFARSSVMTSHRTKVEVLDKGRVRLTVKPGAAGGPGKLTAPERKRLLQSTAQIRANDPKLRKLARRLAPGDSSPQKDAKKILEWVNSHLTYEITPQTIDGVSVLERGRGDCTEYALLTVSLLRAAGVPAEMREGMAASGDELVAHAWVAYHDGDRWHEIDPTWGRMTITSGHLPISVLDTIALISLGKFEILEITRAP